MSGTGGATPEPLPGAEAIHDDPHLEAQRLRGLVTAAEVALRALRDRCDELAESKAHLTRLAVASAQLHESDDEAETLRNLLDLLVNLVGTEQIAVWRLTAGGTALELRASQGIDAQVWRRVAIDDGPLGQAVSSSQVVVTSAPREGGPSVCVPLVVGRRPVGVVGVFGLLPHKAGLGPRDADVFRMISQQAGFALCCAGEPWGPGGQVGDG